MCAQKTCCWSWTEVEYGLSVWYQLLVVNHTFTALSRINTHTNHDSMRAYQPSDIQKFGFFWASDCKSFIFKIFLLILWFGTQSIVSWYEIMYYFITYTLRYFRLFQVKILPFIISLKDHSSLITLSDVVCVFVMKIFNKIIMQTFIVLCKCFEWISLWYST